MRMIFLTATASLLLAAPVLAGIDLIPSFDVATGAVKVKNIGDAAASISVVTIECKRRKPAVVGGGGGCPDPAPAAAAPYSMPAFPNKVAISVPAPLAPGATFVHAIAFFPGLVFAPGTYVFKVRADDGNSVPESNEVNNNKSFVKTVP
jgi:hypothetical protein